MFATGSVATAGGPVPVQGEVWFDHQWGDFDGGRLGWRWFALQLNDGGNLMVYDITDAQGRRLMTTGTLSDAAGVRTFGPEEIRLHSTGAAWTSGRTGIRYPTSWTLALPTGHYEVQPVQAASEFDARDTTFNVYWEGPVRVLGAGGESRGQGFLELSGYGRERAAAAVP